MAHAVTDKEFEDKVLKSKGVVLVDFWAAWCPPCRFLEPIIEQLGQMMGDKTTIYKMDVDANPETSMRYLIRSIPTVKIFKDGQEVENFIGVQPLPVYLNSLKSHSE